MALGDYLAGTLLLGATAGACAATAIALVDRLAAELTGLVRWLAIATLWLAVFVGCHLLTGMLGAMSALTVTLVSLAAFAATRLVAARPPAGAADPPPVAGGRAELMLAGLALAALLAAVVARTLVDGAEPITQYDYTGFRMPNIADWAQAGSFWRFDQFEPRLATGSYPQNGDVVLLGATMPFDSDFLARFAMYPFALLAGASVLATVVELGGRRALGVLAGTAYVAIPALANSAFEYALVDAVMAASFGCGLVFLLRHGRTGRGSDLALAGIGLGLALGSKWYGLTGVPILLVAWAAWSAARGQRPAAIARRAGILIGLIALGGGFWFVRNLVEVGNPVFPADFSILGLTLFDAPPDLHRAIYGATLLDYAGDWDAWSDHILPAFWQGWGLAAPLFAAGVAVAVALRRRAAAGGPVIVGLAAATLATFVAYAVTPYSAPGLNGVPAFTVINTRWVLHGLLIAAVLVGWAASAAPRQLALALAAGLAAATLQGALRLAPELDLALGAEAAIAVAVLAGLLLMLRASALGGRGVAAATVVALAALVVAGRPLESSFADRRYLGLDPTFDRALAAPEPSRIGLSGAWTAAGVEPALPLFGDRLGNRVEYVGETVDGQLRPWQSRARWTAAVRDGAYDLLLVGRSEHLSDDSTEDLWARREGFEVLAQSERFTLYRPAAE